MTARTYLAEWILPIASKPIHNGFVTIVNDRITALGPASANQNHEGAVSDLGHTVVFPALVNSLFHPDYPEADDLQEYRGNFFGWLNASWRKAREISATDVESRILSSIKRCYDYGTAAIGIRTAHPHISAHLEQSGIYSAIFHLIRGFKSYDAREVWESRGSFKNTELVTFYHAAEFLFNLSPNVLRAIAQSNFRTALPLAFIKDEEQFFNDGQGRIYQYLLSREDMDYRWQPPKCSSIKYFTSGAYAARENILSQMILVTEEELDHLNEMNETFHICLHPRFDRSWELGTAPAKLIQGKGFNICLGTFAEHMDMRREMRSASAEYGFSAEQVLEMATLNGARALGFSHHIGSLEIGKDAKIYSVTDANSIQDPYEYILLSTARMTPVI